MLVDSAHAEEYTQLCASGGDCVNATLKEFDMRSRADTATGNRYLGKANNSGIIVTSEIVNQNKKPRWGQAFLGSS